MADLEGHSLVVGASGAGKTVTAKVLTESLVADQRHVCIIDPTGVWYGLRTMADGETPGFDIPIFGGRHGDLAILADQGAAIGEIIAGGVSSILDLSDMDSDEQHHFVNGLITSLRKKPRGNFHLIVDEADEFAPQTSPSSIGEAVKRQMEWIAKRGRVQGFVLMAITQRPADIAKSVISQMQTLVMHQLIAPADMNAVRAYLKDNASKETMSEVMSSLPGLGQGERWIYSPRANILELAKSDLPRTFDTSRTPKPGEDPIEPKMLAELDLSEIAAALAPEPEEEGETQSDLLEAHNSSEELKSLEVKLDDMTRRALTAEYHLASLVKVTTLVREDLAQLGETFGAVEAAQFPSEQHLEQNGWVKQGEVVEEAEVAFDDEPVSPPQRPSLEPATSPVKGDHPPRHQRILDALAWATKMLGKDHVARNIVAWFADTSPKSSGYQNDLSAMRTARLIDYPAGGMLMLTQEGGEKANWPAPALSRADLLEAIKRKLEPRFHAILDYTFALNETSREQLAEKIGRSASSSGFQNDLSKLRSLGLIDYPRAGYVGLGEVLA